MIKYFESNKKCLASSENKNQITNIPRHTIKKENKIPSICMYIISNYETKNEHTLPANIICYK